LFRCFILCLYTYCRWRSSYQEGRVGIPLTGLTRPHFCACPKPEHGFPTSYVGTVVVYFVFSEFIYVIFVDIDGIDDHHCLNFLFIFLLI
jgi:hypothetical protein